MWILLIYIPTAPLISSVNSHSSHMFTHNCQDKQWSHDESVTCSPCEDSKRKPYAPSFPQLQILAWSQTSKVKKLNASVFQLLPRSWKIFSLPKWFSFLLSCHFWLTSSALPWEGRSPSLTHIIGKLPEPNPHTWLRLGQPNTEADMSNCR